MKQRFKGLDILKCIACFLVICIHCPFPSEFGKYFNSISRCAVPIFFMITGFFYYKTIDNKNENKQIIKVLKLCIVSNVIYMIFNILCTIYSGESIINLLKSTFSIKNIFEFLLLNNSPIAGHLWYLGALLYVLIIFKIFNKYNKVKILYIITPFLLICDLVFGKYSLLIIHNEVPIIILRNFLFVGIPYFCIGNYIRNIYDRVNKLSYSTNLILVFVFLVTSILERAILVHFNINATRDHYISTTLFSISLFLLFVRCKDDPNGNIINYFMKIGREYSTIIYIIHPMVITILGILFKDILLYNYFAPIIVFIFSIIICIIYKRIFKNRFV